MNSPPRRACTRYCEVAFRRFGKSSSTGVTSRGETLWRPPTKCSGVDRPWDVSLLGEWKGNFARGYSGNEESSGSGEAAYSNSFFHFSLIFFLKSGLKALTGGKRSFQA